MLGTVAAIGVTTAVTVTAATAVTNSTGSPIADVVVAVAAVITALGVIGKMFHIPELWRGTLNLVRAFNGQPARRGMDAVPGLPEQVQALRQDAEKLRDGVHEIKGRDAQLVVALEELARSTTSTNEAVARVEFRANGIDQRITDHRRRNDETADALRRALEDRAVELDRKLEERADDLEQKLGERNHTVDRRLDALSADLLRAETYRASLVELGIEVDRRDRPRE